MKNSKKKLEAGPGNRPVQLLVLGTAKQHYYQQIDMPERQAYHYAKELMASQAQWPDAIEGMTASIEKEAGVERKITIK